MRPRGASVSLQPVGAGELQGALAALGLRLRAEDVRRLLAELEREPTHAELVLLDSMWSEHCSYKSSRSLLRLLPAEGPHVVLGPGADAGVVRLPSFRDDGSLDVCGGSHCIAVGHESHNHPSQLLPFEGAATGIGGIVRDVYCMGADVIGVLDALRFGDPDGAAAESVRQIARGVVDGIAHYGNALGVPNLGGQVEFDAAFDDNCLVNVVALGILEASELVPSRAPESAAASEYVALLVGKPTDDSGLGGAAFASGRLDTDEDTQQRGAVQLPDPFFKRVLTEANRAALDFLRRDGRPFAMKDLGAAGLGGAASEMAGEMGLELDLDAVHADRPGHGAATLLVAETQERYLLAVPAACVATLRRIYEQEFDLGHMVRGAGACVVGRFDASGRFRASRDGRLEVDLPTGWITKPPQVHWPRAPRRGPDRPQVRAAAVLAGRDPAADLRAVLRSRGGGSRWPLFAHYDSDVQGRTALRPGDADAGLVVPWRGEPLAVAVGLGGPARLLPGEARHAGVTAVCAAVRNVVAVGATPWALTDCLNFGSPETPECMRDLEACVEGLAAAAAALGMRDLPGPLPFVSGNVSLYNESRAGRGIPPTPIVACFGIASDVGRCRGMFLKHEGDVLVRLGSASAALGGSLYAQATGQEALLRSARPPLDLEAERRRNEALLDAFAAGLVAACHDIADGGVLLALLEMSFGRRGRARLGFRCRLGGDDWAWAFAETAGFVCAVRPAALERFETLCAASGVETARLGEVLGAPVLELEHRGGTSRLELDDLADAWLRPLQDVLAEGVPA